MHDDIKSKLNPSQYEAVTTVDGAVLVIAGAGSGKTRAIEYRVAHLVEKGIDPKSILLLTFTRKAAHEMLSRASRHDPRCKDVEGGTFHSFAFKVLKKYAHILGLSGSFSILDESDASEAVHRCGSKLDFFDKERKTPKKDTLRSIISMSVNKGLSVSDILDKEYPHFTYLASEIEKLRKEYAAYKIQKNYLDYDDLLVFLRILLGKTDVHKKLSAKYRYIMVDEYQDTNIIQGDIAYLLAKDHGNIMAVGDDAQSIYGFRGSSHKNIMDFPGKFKNCKVIKLEDNYRSTQSILDIANTVLENMNNKYSKCLKSVRHEEGARPSLNFFKNAYDEAGWIVSRIKELRDEGIDTHHQAVLFRAAYISIPLQAELSRHGIPYQVFGGLKFYETAHVKDLIAHMKVISNHRDEIAWHRVLTHIEGIGPKTADRLTEEIIGKSSLAEVIDKVLAPSDRPEKALKNTKRLASFLKSASSFKVGPGTLYDLTFDYYFPIMQGKFDDWHIRLNDLEALRQISSRYESLAELLGDFAIEPPDRGVLKVEAKSHEDEKPIVLSTIHSAKGLEWDTVFLIGLVDGVLPSAFALNDAESIEEESRLLYVAVTRAKDRLFLSLCHEGMRGGISQFNKISRFIDSSNILARLDQNLSEEVSDGDSFDLDDGDGINISYDKDSLLKDVLEF
ncbi:MAG TPA: ATP-dependent helicase [Candidatus Omnitrophota bacterium]|nr:ATP-dependent helicase [Candidatus Omnitrophota bacterium]